MDAPNKSVTDIRTFSNILKTFIYISGIDLMQCCKDAGVKESCLGICSFNLDLDFLLFDSECIPEFDKAMACGSGEFYMNLRH